MKYVYLAVALTLALPALASDGPTDDTPFGGLDNAPALAEVFGGETLWLQINKSDLDLAGGGTLLSETALAGNALVRPILVRDGLRTTLVIGPLDPAQMTLLRGELNTLHPDLESREVAADKLGRIAGARLTTIPNAVGRMANGQPASELWVSDACTVLLSSGGVVGLVSIPDRIHAGGVDFDVDAMIDGFCKTLKTAVIRIEDALPDDPDAYINDTSTESDARFGFRVEGPVCGSDVMVLSNAFDFRILVMQEPACR